MPLELPQIRQLFMLLHGMYGNQLLDKFRTGEVIHSGEHAGQDKGLVSAQRVWLHSLHSFEFETVRAAVERCKKLHKTFAPTLPEFEEICHSLRPRYARPQAPALPMSEELKHEVRQRNREALAQAKLKRFGSNEFGTGVQALAAMVVKSVGDAGGDEVAALLRLEQALGKKAQQAGQDGREAGG
jgi:hypothetical protein